MKIWAEEEAEKRMFEDVPPTRIGQSGNDNESETEEELQDRYRQQYQEAMNNSSDFKNTKINGYNKNKARVNPVHGDVPRAKAAPKRERRKSKQDDYQIPEPEGQQRASSSDFPNSFDNRARSSPPQSSSSKQKPEAKAKEQKQQKPKQEEKKQERPKSAPPAKVFRIYQHAFYPKCM